MRIKNTGKNQMNFIISLIANVYLIVIGLWCVLFTGSSISTMLTEKDFGAGIVFPTVLCIFGAIISAVWLCYCNPFKERGSLMTSDKLFLVIYFSMLLTILGVKTYAY